MMIRDFVIFIRCIKILKHLVNQLSDKVVLIQRKRKGQRIISGGVPIVI